jgi:lipoprotein NlpI
MKMTKLAPALLVVAVFIGLFLGRSSAQGGAGCSALLGEWNWSTTGVVATKGVVRLKDDHTVLYDGKPAGKWECKDDTRGAIAIYWVTGFIDSITVAGDRLSGSSTMSGVTISGTHKGPAPANPKPASSSKPQPVASGKPDPVTVPSPDTSRPDARLAAGWCVIDHDNYQQAIAFLDSALSRNPRDAQALYYRGRCWHYANQPQRAIQDLSASLQLDPHNSWAYLYRGRALNTIEGRNKYQVEADFTHAIQADFNNGDAYFARAVLYSVNFPTKGLEAFQDATLAIDLKPRFAEAYVVRADILMDYNRAQAALADLNQAKVLDPNYPDLECRYGLVYWIAGQRPLGDQSLGRCYARDPAARSVYEKEKNVRLQIAAENARRAAAIAEAPCNSHSWGFCSSDDTKCRNANETSYSACMSWHRQ